MGRMKEMMMAALEQVTGQPRGHEVADTAKQRRSPELVAMLKAKAEAKRERRRIKRRSDAAAGGFNKLEVIDLTKETI